MVETNIINYGYNKWDCAIFETSGSNFIEGKREISVNIMDLFAVVPQSIKKEF